LKIILLDHQNNYIGRSIIEDTVAKSFNILSNNLNVLHNYFDSANKIIFRSVSKFLNISTKLFFPYVCTYNMLKE